MNPNEPQEPHNIEAEQQLLGAILTNNTHFDKVSDILTVDHFFDPVHARIFDRCAARITKSHLVSPVTLKAEFETDEGLKDLGGPAYLVRMQAASVSAFAIREYAFVIIDMWTRRQLLQSARETISRLYDGEDFADVRNDVEATLSTLQATNDQVPFRSIASSVEGLVREMNDAYQKETDPGISTGFPSLDNILGGLAGGDVMTLAGATSMGKTSVGLAIADKVAQRGEAVAIISLEMSDQSLASRLISSASKVPYQEMRRASRLSQNQMHEIITKAGSVGQRPIFIVPPYIRDTVAIHGAVRAIRAECANRGIRLGLVLLDYLQLVRAPGKGTVERVGNASTATKGMATQLDVPVISLAQLNRGISAREDKRPMLADLKDSSQIEQDSDQVVFCHREEYWLERDQPKKGADPETRNDYEVALKAVKGQVELIVAKNRHGSLGTAKLELDAATNTMKEIYGNDRTQHGMDFA